MIEHIKDTLNKMERIVVVYYPEKNGKYTATFKAVVSDKAGAEVKQLAECPPMRLHGTAEEIDTQLPEKLANWSGMMSDAFDSLQEVDEF